MQQNPPLGEHPGGKREGDDVVARRISRTAAARSEKNCKPCWHSTRSNASSGTVRAIAFPSRHSIVAPAGAGSPRATASISGLISSATTFPSAPTRGATCRATLPVPHATSIARSPGCGAAYSSSARVHGEIVGPSIARTFRLDSDFDVGSWVLFSDDTRPHPFTAARASSPWTGSGTVSPRDGLSDTAGSIRSMTSRPHSIPASEPAPRTRHRTRLRR